MIRVTVNGESVQFSSKLDIEPELWDATNQKMIGTTKAAREFNALLDDIRTSLRNHYREIEKYEAYVTAEKVRNAFLGRGWQDLYSLIFTGALKPSLLLRWQAPLQCWQSARRWQ